MCYRGPSGTPGGEPEKLEYKVEFWKNAFTKMSDAEYREYCRAIKAERKCRELENQIKEMKNGRV